MTTIFTTPILSGALRLLAAAALALTGWKVEGGLPDDPKFVIVGAPHTSNWDFLLFLGIVFQLRADLRFMGKAELFKPPFGAFFRYCGGIPVDRSKSSGLVEQTVEAIRKAERFQLMITPEGTRHKVTEWKRGFWHIAKGANIPVVLAVLDGVRKSVHVGQVVHLTGDMEADIRTLQGFFKGKVGIHPHLTSEY